MKISILIPCHNEEKSIAKCVQSCLDQTRPADQILVVDDGSTDDSTKILAEFGDRIEVAHIPYATGNKSYAQEFGLHFITGDVFVATDGDTLLDKDFLKQVEADFLADPEIAAVSGYVRSLRHNWITACREIEYTIGQDLHKLAQSNISFIFVIPGCAGAFRTEIFKNYVKFEHDTLTEDLDFTYKLHFARKKIKYERRAISYTQDPFTLKSYRNQMRRWYGGGWQNLLKHFRLAKRPVNAFELSIIYADGLIFSLTLLMLPLLNLTFLKHFIIPYFGFIILQGGYAALRRKRLDLFFYSPLYVILIIVNIWIFWEQFVKEILLRKKNLIWFKPERIKM